MLVCDIKLLNAETFGHGGSVPEWPSRDAQAQDRLKPQISGAHSSSLELGAVCDTDPVTLIAHQERYAVKGYDLLEDMLRNEELDLVALCTPSGLHPDQAVLAAKYGVNVVTEKPMATRWQDGVRMVKACDQANVRLLVVKQNRRNSTLQMLKRAFDEKSFGWV